MSSTPKKLTQQEVVLDELVTVMLEPDEQKHLVSFFNVLIDIDRQNLDEGRAAYYVCVGAMQ